MAVKQNYLLAMKNPKGSLIKYCLSCLLVGIANGV